MIKQVYLPTIIIESNNIIEHNIPPGGDRRTAYHIEFARAVTHFHEVTTPFSPVENNAYQPIGQPSNGVSIEMDLLRVGSEPVGMRCPYCQDDVMTQANYTPSRLTHVVAAVLAIFFW